MPASSKLSALDEHLLTEHHKIEHLDNKQDPYTQELQ